MLRGLCRGAMLMWGGTYMQTPGTGLLHPGRLQAGMEFARTFGAEAQLSGVVWCIIYRYHVFVRARTHCCIYLRMCIYVCLHLHTCTVLLYKSMCMVIRMYACACVMCDITHILLPGPLVFVVGHEVLRHLTGVQRSIMQT